MEIRNIRIVENPKNPSRTRLQADVSSRTSGSESCWFEVDAPHRAHLSVSGNPWLAAFLPIAAAIGEPMIIGSPVDSWLVDNARRLLAIWKDWYPSLSDVVIECETDRSRMPRRDRVAMLFGGGVDSLFTLLSREGGGLEGQAGRVDDLLSVCGFDVPLSQAEDCSRIHSTRRAIAERLGKRNIEIWTNLRETQFQKVPWGRLSHGAALAAVGLMFERRYDTILVPSTHRADHVVPWGSHPLTDPLFSTRDVRVVHDGGGYSRVEKTEHIVKWELSLETLRVCAYSRSADNCSECVKCFRTMATLELLGVLPRSRTFQMDKYSVEKLATVYCADENEESFWREIRAQALRRGRQDIVQAIDHALGQSARRRKLMALAESMQRLTGLWRLGHALERVAIAGHIR